MKLEGQWPTRWSSPRSASGPSDSARAVASAKPVARAPTSTASAHPVREPARRGTTTGTTTSNRAPTRDKGPWWANNRHDWWDDRQGPPPWGWGPPPAYQWTGGPPQPFNYWGYDVNPVWDDGFRQWGIWLFGLWIPIFGIGVQ